METKIDSEENDEPVPVCVAVRVKAQDQLKQGRCVIVNPNGCELSVVNSSVAPEKYKFDHVLPENLSQYEVYQKVLQPFLQLFFDGYDLFVILYGGSQTGKTFSAFGPELSHETDQGLFPRFVRQIFDNFNESEMNLKVSSFDVTNDDVCDLLAQDSRRKSLLGKVDVDIEPATEIKCSNSAEVLSYYEASLDLKKLRNEEISHSFFKVILEQRIGNVGKKSTVTFVDLAASDRMLGSSLQGNVDIGLLALGNVVSALGDPRRNVRSLIPFQDSLLIRLLRNAFGGRALTLLFSCISPKLEDIEETFNTLHFARSATNIRNNPLPNVSNINSEFQNEEEEIRFINQNKLPNMPDLINPQFNLMPQFLMQQQMLTNYLLLLQQQKSSPLSTASPFIPITPPVTESPKLDLKSPLQLNANENNRPLNLPQEVENHIAVEPKTSQRKSSLANIQKTLDSILEESEHDSSIKKSISSVDSSLENTEEGSEEDFDSDCSIYSEIEENSDDFFKHFEAETQDFISCEQERILEEILKIPFKEKQCEKVETLADNLAKLDFKNDSSEERSRVDELRRYKDSLRFERQNLEHFMGHSVKKDPLSCRLCRNNEGEFGFIDPEADHEKRLVEIDVLFEAIDELIDMKNAVITGHQYSKPYVDNPGEQDFLMAQLNSLSAIEAKSLLHTLLHRTIDLRMRGKSTDLELRKKDEEERTNKKKFRYMNDLCLFLDRNVKKQDRDKDKLKAEVEYWKEKAAKYKKYYVYHQNSTKSANDSLKNEEKSHEEAVKLPVSSAKNIKFEGNRLIFEPESKSRIRHTTRHK